jgi:hypothetical protein
LHYFKLSQGQVASGILQPNPAPAPSLTGVTSTRLPTTAYLPQQQQIWERCGISRHLRSPLPWFGFQHDVQSEPSYSAKSLAQVERPERPVFVLSAGRYRCRRSRHHLGKPTSRRTQIVPATEGIMARDWLALQPLGSPIGSPCSLWTSKLGSGRGGADVVTVTASWVWVKSNPRTVKSGPITTP